MDAPNASSSTEVTLFLDGDELYATGGADALDVVLADLLGPDEASKRRSATKLASAGAVGATLAAAAVSGEELLRLTPESAAKLAKYGAQLTDGGALRGYVRDGSHFAGDLSFDSISLSAEQALSLQTAAVSLALRSAIADVQAAVEAVDRKVSDIQKRVRAREVGEVVGTFRYLQQCVASTRARGRLLDADWDQVSGVRKDLEVALESLRAYVTDSINDIDSSASLPKREAAIKRLADPKGAAGSLQLILIAEQALHLLEYLRLERIRTTDPEHLQSALSDARQGLADQRERDEQLLRAAAQQINAARQVHPLEIYRQLSIPQLERTSTRASETLLHFAEASRAELPHFDERASRPALADTSAEVRRHALTARDGVVGASKAVGRATSRNAKKTSEAVRNRARRDAD